MMKKIIRKNSSKIIKNFSRKNFHENLINNFRFRKSQSFHLSSYQNWNMNEINYLRCVSMNLEYFL
jgi:hypothetical protein